MYDALGQYIFGFPVFSDFYTQSVDSLPSRRYNRIEKQKANTQIEVALFISTFYEVLGTDEEKGKGGAPKEGTA